MTLELGESDTADSDGVELAMVTSVEVVVVVIPSDEDTRHERVPLTGAMVGLKEIFVPVPITEPFINHS